MSVCASHLSVYNSLHIHLFPCSLPICLYIQLSIDATFYFIAQPSIAAGTIALGAALVGIPAALEAPRGGPTTQSSSLGIKAIDVPRTAQSPTTLAEQYANTVASAEAERLDQDWIATVKKANAERREQDYNVATGKKAEGQSL